MRKYIYSGGELLYAPEERGHDPGCQSWFHGQNSGAQSPTCDTLARWLEAYIAVPGPAMLARLISLERNKAW